MVGRSTEGGTEFRFRNPVAHQVFLVGDFNDWQERSLPMARDEDEEGEWVCRLSLPEGVYCFRYLADGEWQTEHDSSGIGWAPFDCNSITIINHKDLPACPVG